MEGQQLGENSQRDDENDRRRQRPNGRIRYDPGGHRSDHRPLRRPRRGEQPPPAIPSHQRAGASAPSQTVIAGGLVLVHPRPLAQARSPADQTDAAVDVWATIGAPPPLRRPSCAAASLTRRLHIEIRGVHAAVHRACLRSASRRAAAIRSTRWCLEAHALAVTWSISTSTLPWWSWPRPRRRSRRPHVPLVTRHEPRP